MTAPIIVAEALTKKFGEETAVHHLNLEVPPGQIFAFIGPSGSGKTSTVRMLTGYYTPTSGTVEILGKPPLLLTAKERRKIGYMPQLFALYQDLTVWENLNFSASLYGMGLFRRKRLKELLELVELLPHRRKSASRISGGMQRRLSLAASMVHDPEILFLDEPTAGIDPVLRRKFWDHFRAMRSEGRTFLITTQYVTEASYCDKVGVLVKGSFVCVDTPDGLRRRAFGGEIVNMTLESSTSRDLNFIQKMEQLPFVKGRIQISPDGSIRVVVNQSSTAIPDLLDFCRSQNIEVKSIEQYFPPFDDVFVRLVKQEEES